MLNDEIDEVRIGSLYGIASFNEVMKLNKSDVDTVLFNLSEDNAHLRKSIYNFFGEILIDTDSLMKYLMEKLINNLLRYPQD
jgi:uncharacterized radical SAM superfamily protein